MKFALYFALMFPLLANAGVATEVRCTCHLPDKQEELVKTEIVLNEGQAQVAGGSKKFYGKTHISRSCVVTLEKSLKPKVWSFHFQMTEETDNSKKIIAESEIQASLGNSAHTYDEKNKCTFWVKPVKDLGEVAKKLSLPAESNPAIRPNVKNDGKPATGLNVTSTCTLPSGQVANKGSAAYDSCLGHFNDPGTSAISNGITIKDK